MEVRLEKGGSPSMLHVPCTTESSLEAYLRSSDLRQQLNHKKLKEDLEFIAGWGSFFFVALVTIAKVLKHFGIPAKSPEWLGTHIPALSVPAQHSLPYALSGVGALMIFALVHLRDRKVRKFFGLARSRGLLFVLPTFRPDTKCGAFKPLTRGKNATLNGQDWDDEELRNLGSSPITYHTDIAGALSLFKVSRELRSMDVLIDIDENVMDADLIRPATDTVDERVVFCLGSDSSNYLTRYLLAAAPFISQPEFYRLIKTGPTVRQPPNSNYVLKCAKAFSHKLKLVYADDRTTDYAVISRRTEGATTFFVCAGLDGQGTQAAVTELLENWESLASFSKGKDFYCLYQVHKLNRPIVSRTLLRAVCNRAEKYEFSLPN